MIMKLLLFNLTSFEIVKMKPKDILVHITSIKILHLYVPLSIYDLQSCVLSQNIFLGLTWLSSLLEVQLHISYPSVGWLVGWSAGWSFCHNFLRGPESYTPMNQSKHSIHSMFYGLLLSASFLHVCRLHLLVSAKI